ncbi:hypothetical protein QJS10_CPA05g01831 [Acorus calamus]|uniref:Uncharacterized protein n=1 Tax=Acorus calamus TaxID=4465 RepID=A0AAV9EPC3_ACOCL|nr:hypothetical protein QJS10_CPA05g01831 [Acorus calamus]
MRKVVILCLGLWWEWLYSQESSSDGVSVGLSEARDSSRDGMIVSGAFSRFILDAHGIRWFRSATRQSGWMTESLSQDTGFDGLVLYLDASCESVEARVNSGCPSRGSVSKVHPGRPRYPMVQIGYASEWLDDGEP